MQKAELSFVFHIAKLFTTREETRASRTETKPQAGGERERCRYYKVGVYCSNSVDNCHNLRQRPGRSKLARRQI